MVACHERAPRLTRAVFSMSVVTALFVAACARDSRGPTVRGAGASLSAPLVSRWAEAYVGPGRVDYRAIGSGGAAKFLEVGTIDFGVRDVPLTSVERTRVHLPLVEVPVAHGAIAVAANLPGVSDLRLGRATLAGIFSGDIDRWNDPLIAHDNPSSTLPDLPILRVHRTDASGTLRLFTEYVAASSPTFAERVGTGESPRFPNAVRAKGTDGVARALKATRGSLGVLELGIARNSGLAVASLEDTRGTFVAPTALTSPATTYPLVSTVYVLVPTDASPRTKIVVSFVRWSLTEGQGLLAGGAELATLAFGPLSEDERTRALALLDARDPGAVP